MAIPKISRRSFFDRELPIEVLLAIGAVAVGFSSLYKAKSDYEAGQSPGWIVSLQIGGSFALVVAAVYRIFRARRKDQKEDDARDPGDLSGCVHVLYSILAKRLSIAAPDGTLRITLYRVEKSTNSTDPDSLEQVIDYVGGGGGSKGRVFSSKSGIIGLVARTGDPTRARRRGTTPEECLKELMSKWGYTAAEAKEISVDRLAWMAVPIYGESPNNVIGVLYLDSKRPELFDDSNVQKIVLYATMGIARFVELRYS